MAKKKKAKATQTKTKKVLSKKKPAAKKKPVAKKKAKSTTKRRATPKKVKATGEHLRQSKTSNFLEKIRENNSMIDYMTRLRVLNPPSERLIGKQDPKTPRREGSFVRLAHANEEFTAPVLSKGKSVASTTKIVDNKNQDEE